MEGLDLDRCAADFPEYSAYLQNLWGNRSVYTDEINEEPVGKSDTSGRCVFSLDLLPNGTAALDVASGGRGPPGRRVALTRLLRGVVDRNQDAFATPLKKLGNLSVYWRHMGGDCPETKKRKGLPLQGWSSDPRHTDIAMPDFTFENYKEIHSEETSKDWLTNSWEDVSRRLQNIKKEKKGFVWRGSGSSGVRWDMANLVNKGPPEHLKSLLAEVAPDGWDVKVMDWEGSGNEKRTDFISLYDQCKYTYTFHAPGHHYSAMLKYKLACGQTVFMLGTEGNMRQEFWYDTLHHGKNIYFIKENLSNFWEVLEEAFNASSTERAGEHAAAVARAGKNLVDEYLSQRGLDCYMVSYFSKYYFPLLLHATERPTIDGQEVQVAVSAKGVNMEKMDESLCGECGCNS